MKIKSITILCCSFYFFCFSGCAHETIKTVVEYRDCPNNSIVVDGKAYSKDAYKVVVRKSYEEDMKTLVDLRSMLDECLERERIK